MAGAFVDYFRMVLGWKSSVAFVPGTVVHYHDLLGSDNSSFTLIGSDSGSKSLLGSG